MTTEGKRRLVFVKADGTAWTVDPMPLDWEDTGEGGQIEVVEPTVSCTSFGRGR